MIFWTGKWFFFLANKARVENVCVSIQDSAYGRSYANLNFLFYKRGGFGILKRIAIMFSDRVDVYTYTFRLHVNPKEKKPEFSLPIVSEFEPIGGYPERLAIVTENIDLLRELIARGKKVTWVTPNLVKFAHLIPQLKFEHVIINPFTENDLVLPTGEYRKNHFSKETMSKDYALLAQSRLPFAKMLGFNMRELARNYDSKKYYEHRRKIGKIHKTPKKFFIGHYFAAAYYNILSITYMLCKKSFVTNVKRKNVPKG